MSRIYKVNESYFDSICSEGKAYWLGFLAADGCIQRDTFLYIGLAERDAEHLFRLKRSLRSTHPVHIYDSLGYRRCQLRIGSRHLVTSLGRQGVGPNKTANLTFPDLQPWLLRHYLRGYVDGDGGFYCSHRGPGYPVYSFSVTGYEPFILDFQRALMQNCSLRPTQLRKRHPAGPSAMLRYGGQVQVIRIADYLYRAPCRFYLRRKKPTFIR